MLQFPEDYFKKEMQDGFIVSEIMKRIWAASLEVLQKTIDICEKYKLNYVVYWGTLLGAVRHKGFIPWDDDLDIALNAEDYVKFLSVAKEEFPEEYCVLNVYTTDGYKEYFTRVTNGDWIDTGTDRMTEYHNCPFAVGVDVFPLYYIPRNQQCAEEQKMLLSVIEQLYGMIEHRKKMEEEGAEEVQLYSEAIARNVLALQKTIGYQAEKGKNLITQLGIMYDQICRLYTAEESDVVTSFPVYLKTGYCVPKEVFHDSIMMPFENIMVRAPKGYDEILRKNYKDYMIPVRNPIGHLCFNGQMKELLKELCPLNGYVYKNDNQAEDLWPENWQKKMYFSNEKGQRVRKKIVLYSPVWGEMICNGGYAADKLRKVLQTFKKTQNVLLWWVVYPINASADNILSSMSPVLVEEYWQIVNEYLQEDWGICDDTEDRKRAVSVADAYYGDECELLQLFKQTGKCAMIQNYEI